MLFSEFQGEMAAFSPTQYRDVASSEFGTSRGPLSTTQRSRETFATVSILSAVALKNNLGLSGFSNQERCVRMFYILDRFLN